MGCVAPKQAKKMQYSKCRNLSHSITADCIFNGNDSSRNKGIILSLIEQVPWNTDCENCSMKKPQSLPHTRAMFGKTTTTKPASRSLHPLTKSCAETSAPLRVRAVTVSMWPAAEARWRAVRPSCEKNERRQGVKLTPDTTLMTPRCEKIT